MTAHSFTSPYLEFDRTQWRELRKSTPQVFTEDEVIALRGIGENIDLAEATDVYLPLSRLIHLQVKARQKLHEATATFLGEGQARNKIPFIIGVSGSVAVGKSTTSRLLQLMLARWESHPRVDLVTTDGFLYPTAELNRRGILARKGFPESYDRRALLNFINAVKAGRPEVHAPVYSHVIYDRVPDQTQVIAQPDILIVEGLNVLQTGPTIMVSDFFDFSIYVDARVSDIEKWYIDRFLTLRGTAFSRPDSYFRHYADLSDEEAVTTARTVWRQVNYPNLVQNIRPTRVRADLVLWKSSDHSIDRIRMRKV